MRKEKQQHGGNDQAIGIIIGKSTENNACAQRNTVCFFPAGFPARYTGAEYDGAGKRGHGIRIDIGMKKQILGQEHDEQAEQPAAERVVKQKE